MILCLLPVLFAVTPPTTPTGDKDYDAHYLWFEDYVLVGVQTGAVHGTFSQVFEGKYKRPLPWAEFYQKVGGEELASRYRTRRAVKWSLVGGGSALMIGGVVVMTVGLFQSINSPCSHFSVYDGPGGTNVCDRQATSNTTAYLVAGGVSAGVGLVAAFVGIFFNPKPIEDYEARALAEKYNQGLLERKKNEDPGLRVDVAPLIAPKTLGLAVAGTF